MRKHNNLMMNVLVVMMLVFSFLFVIVPVFREPVSAATTTGYTDYNTQSGYLQYAGNYAWATAHDAATCLATYNTKVQGEAYKDPTWCTLKRGVVFFDTSGIPDDAIIDSASLVFTTGTVANAPKVMFFADSTFNRPGTSRDTGDYKLAYYDTNVGISPTLASTTAYNVSMANVSSVINVAGITGFIICEYAHDYLYVEPGAATDYNTGDIAKASVKLWVTYTIPIVPFSIYISDPSPLPGAVDVATNPTLSLYVGNLHGYRMNATFFVFNMDTDYAVASMTSALSIPPGFGPNQTVFSTCRLSSDYILNGYNVFALDTKFYWYVNISDGMGNFRNFPNESSDGDIPFGSIRAFNFTTRSVNNTDLLAVNDINLNTTVGHTEEYVNGSGWVVNYTAESQMGTSENLVNATGTHQYRWNSTSGFWWAWANVTGDITPLNLIENIVDAAGSHEQKQNSTGYWVYANYTGNAGPTFMSTNLSVINPNPGNGTHLTNYLEEDASGLTTSVDVQYNNFTTPPALMPGDYDETYTGEGFTTGGNVQNISGVSYDACRNNTNGQVVSGPLTCGQYENAGDYFVVRFFLMFDTSSIPDEAVITSSHIAMVVYESDYTDVDFNVTIQQVKPPTPHNPLLSTDYNKALFPSDITRWTYANKNISGYVDGDWFNLTLNATGLTWVNLSGYTYFGVRSNQDVIHDAPGVGVDEWIQFYAPGGVHPEYGPRLVVNYTIPSSNWAHFVNLTWYSNSSGAWLPYYVSYVNSNGTTTVSAVNFSGVDTYFWNTSWNSNHTNYGNSSVFQFETVTAIGGGSFGVSASKRVTTYFVLGLSFGCLLGGMVLEHRRKKKKAG